MILAIIIEMDVVLVFHLFRQILYPENEETTGDGANGGGGKRNLNVVERLVLIFGETVNSIGYVAPMPSHLPC